MSSGKDRVVRAAEECDEEGFERDDGKWVDPVPVQRVAIEEGFRQAVKQADSTAGTDDFDVWSVINPDAALREGDTVAENFRRVWDQWKSTTNRDEIKQAYMEDKMEDLEQDVDE